MDYQQYKAKRLSEDPELARRYAEEQEAHADELEECRHQFDEECKAALARDPGLCGGLCGVCPADCPTFPVCIADEIIASETGD